MASDLPDRLRWLADAMTSCRAHSIEGIAVDVQQGQSMIEQALIGVTALVRQIAWPCVRASNGAARHYAKLRAANSQFTRCPR